MERDVRSIVICEKQDSGWKRRAVQSYARIKSHTSCAQNLHHVHCTSCSIAAAPISFVVQRMKEWIEFMHSSRGCAQCPSIESMPFATMCISMIICSRRQN